MSNIGWNRHNPPATVIPTPKRKVPHTKRQRVKEGMEQAQINGIKQWNLMIDVLEENGLMESE